MWKITKEIRGQKKTEVTGGGGDYEETSKMKEGRGSRSVDVTTNRSSCGPRLQEAKRTARAERQKEKAQKRGTPL